MARVTRAFRNANLRQQLYALRHLPQGTRLPEPATQFERQLLRDLMELPDEIDPLAWLRDRADIRTAQLTLWILMRVLALRIKSFRSLGDTSLFRSEQRLLQPFEDARTSALDLAIDFDRPELDIGAAETVLGQLSVLWRERSVGLGSDRNELEDHDQLLWSLLELPEKEDPIRWIASNHGDVAASMTLGYLLDQTNPSKIMPRQRSETGRSGSIDPIALARDDDQVWVLIENVTFYASGFTLTMRYRLSPPMLAGSPDGPDSGAKLTWLGFTRARDDKGNTYLRYGLQSRGDREKRQTLRFYPAVVSEATELTFEATPAIVYAYSRHPSRGLSTMPHLEIGNISWRVTIP